MHTLLMVTTAPRTLHFLTPIAEHFRKLGWRVDALTGPPAPRDGVISFDRVREITWSRNPLDMRNLLLAPRRVRRAVLDEAYDIVHVHTPVAAFVTRFALRARDRSRPPCVIYTAHGFHFHAGGTLLKNAAFLALEKLAARWTDHVVVMNREDAAVARRFELLPEDRIWPMPGIGVNLCHYAADRVAPARLQALRDELRTGADPCFLMVGEFIPRKRHADVLRAFATIAAEPDLPRCRLLLVGEGALLGAMQAMARELRLQDRVHFLGVRSDIPVLMRAARALVLPSAQEGLPRVVLEAMSMGLPVIGSSIRGTAELLENGHGFLYPVGDTAALAARMRTVLLEPAVAAEAAARASQRVVRYDERTVIRLHEALYAAALAGRSSAPGWTRYGT